MSKETTSPNSLTDWKRVGEMSNEDIDFSDCAEVTPEMFAKAVVRKGLKPMINKTQVTLSLDTDVLDWFKSEGGYQTRINALLRAYMKANKG